MSRYGLYRVIGVPEWCLYHHIRSLLTVFNCLEYYLLRHRGGDPYVVRSYYYLLSFAHEKLFQGVSYRLTLINYKGGV